MKTKRFIIRILAQTLLIVAFMTRSGPVWAIEADALPTGGRIVAGQGSIAQAGRAMSVTQASDKMIADWTTFNVGEQAAVNFIQPGAQSIALNRVLGRDPSYIYGNLTANGQVFFINPSGVYFGPHASVDVGGLVASTLNLSDEAFLNGHYTFSGDETNAGLISNQGHLKGNVIALLAPRVSNGGTIATLSGSAVLAGGNRVSLDFNGDGLMSVNVDAAAFDALVENKGVIKADGGLVVMTAKAAQDLLTNVVNNEGTLEAKGIVERNGRIILEGGDHGIIRAAGVLDVSSDNGRGGDVTVTGDKVLIDGAARIAANGATGGGDINIGGGPQGKVASIRNAHAVYLHPESVITADATGSGHGGMLTVYSDGPTRAYGHLSARGGAGGGNGGLVETSGGVLDLQYAPDISAVAGHGGTWLIDPYNITVAVGGASTNINGASPFQSSNNNASLGVNLIDTALGSGDVIIRTGGGGAQAGDITWNVDYTYSGANARSLTLEAHRDIILNQTIASDNGALGVTLTADSDSNSSGGIVVKEDLTTNGGHLIFNGLGTIFSGSTAQSLTTSGGNITFNGEVLLSNTSGLTMTTGGGNVTFGGILNSGNSYAYDSTTRTWNNWLASAASGAGGGVGHTYLATVTSALEMTAVMVASQGNQAWLGGSDRTTEGTWRWVSGPEGLENSGVGRIFQTSTSQGLTGYSGYNGAFVNWNGGEPNDSGGNEDALQLGFGVTGQWNDLPVNSSTLGAVIETNLAASALTVNAGAGTVTLSGAVGGNKPLSTLDVTANTIAVNGGAVTTEAAQTYSGAVTLGSSATVLTQTNANADFTLAASRTIANATGGNASLTVKTTRGIFLNAGSSISSSAGALGVTLNSDSDADNSGDIQIIDSAITSNGGNILLGGGSNAGTYAYGTANAGSLDRGVVISNSTLSAGGGNITVRGHGYSAGSTPIGADITLNSLLATTGAGTITIDGYGGGNTGVATGINLWNSAGTGATIRTQNGTISLTGTGGSGTRNDGIGYDTATSYIYSTAGGAISLTGTAGASGYGIAPASGGALVIGSDGTNTYASNITLTADAMNLTNSSIRSTGALTVQPLSAGTTIGLAGGAGTLALTAANFSTNFVDGFSGITIGKSNAGTITLGGALTVTDDITLLTTDNIALNAALNASGQRVTLTGGNGDTVSGNGNITAGSLLLNGTGTIYTLNTAPANSVGTLASTGAASVNLINSGSLTVGSVGATDGVTAAGNITIETQGSTADLTLSKPVTTTNGTIVLAAARHFINSNASNTGLVPGTGRYLVYSTNPANTTEAMTPYNKHYNQTYSAGSTPAYAAAGNWFLYTLAPVLSVTPAPQTITYGDATPAFTPGYTGFIDGDVAAGVGISGTASYTIGGGSSTAGYLAAGQHNVTYASGLSSTLGYSFSDDGANNELTVTPKNLTISGVAARNKMFDGNTTAVLFGTPVISPLGADAVTVSGGSAAFADSSVGDGKAVTVSGYTFSGADGGNYAPVQPSGLTANITPFVSDTSSIVAPASGVTGTTETVTSTMGAATNSVITPGSGSNSLPSASQPVVLEGASLSTATSTNPITLTPGTGGMTLTFVDAGQESSQPTVSHIALFVARGTDLSPQGSIEVADAGRTLSVSSSTQQVLTHPDLMAPITASESFDVNLAAAGIVRLSVAVTADGVVIIRGLKEAPAIDMHSAILTGLAVAKQKLHLEPERITSIVLVK